jgi:opacity protein-like surface antigen
VHPPTSQILRLSVLAIGSATAVMGSLSFAQSQTPATPAVPIHCTPVSRANNQRLTTPAPSSCPVKRRSDTSISLGIFPQLTIDRTSDFIGYSQQGTAPSTGVLGTFRQTFHAWLGYSVNLGYSRVSEQYRNLGGSSYYSNFNIDANMYESSVTYIAHTPVNKRFSLFGDIGPGLLTFLPVHRGADAIDYFPYQQGNLVPSVQVRPAGVFGSGVDLHLTQRLDLRAEYRGLFYSNPDFRTGDILSKQVTLTSEPTFSLVYHFHKTKP